MTGPTPADVHVPTAMGNGKKKRKPLARQFVDTYKSGGLYVARLVQNLPELRTWAASQGLPNLDPDSHVTIVHSDVDIPWVNKTDTITASVVGWATLGVDKAVVLLLDSPELYDRWEEAMEAGAASDFDSYVPHVTLFYLEAGYDSTEFQDGEYPDLPTFDIVLGPELSGDPDKNIFSKGLLDVAGSTDTGRPTGSLPPEPMTADDIAAIAKAVATHLESSVGKEDDGLVPIVKVDVEKRMIWGWASVVTKGGKPVVDIQDDIIEVPELEKAAWEFMDSSRMGGERHTIMGVGTVVDSIVFSKDLQDALGIDLGKEGWFVGVRVDNDSTWEKVKKGELKMFSIGGKADRVPVGKAYGEEVPPTEEPAAKPVPRKMGSEKALASTKVAGKLSEKAGKLGTAAAHTAARDAHLTAATHHGTLRGGQDASAAHHAAAMDHQTKAEKLDGKSFRANFKKSTLFHDVVATTFTEAE